MLVADWSSHCMQIRTQKLRGQRIETDRAWCFRYYVTTRDGRRVKKYVKLADKSEQYRCR